MITNPITIFYFLMRRASTAAIQDRCARKMFRRYCSLLVSTIAAMDTEGARLDLPIMIRGATSGLNAVSATF
jgi:hypothetical protein